MTQSNSDRIEEIFHAALALPHSDRRGFVEKECAGDVGCVGEVMSLLAAHARSGILDEAVVSLGVTDNLEGRTVEERYVVERALPHGAMGKVYVARDLQLRGAFRVIKILPNASVKDPEAVRRFKLEVTALTLIDHPGVVSVYGAGELDGKPYIVMQYIDGLTLRTEIKGGMELGRTAALLQQIGAAVGHIHDKGILHRDLKPENIMLQLLSDGTEVVKIVDFGIAKITDSVGATGALNTVPIGTLAYMSPEQLRPGGVITVASDIYSIAVVACEMITGERPQQSDPSPHRRWRPQQVHLSSRIPTKARRVIAKALSFNADDRYQSAKQFCDELAEALKITETRGPEWRPLRKWLSIAAAVLILLILSYKTYDYLVTPQSRVRPLTSTTTTPMQSKGFNFWIIVQGTVGGKDYGPSYKSNGDDIFNSGEKFQLSVLSLESGYLYIFNEGQPEQNRTSFRMLYPEKSINDGSASVGANHTVQSEWMTFRGPAGTENFWIVWSESPLRELESAKDEAFNHPQAGLTDEHLEKLKHYLQTKDAEVNARTARYKATQEVQVRSKSDVALTLVQFKHR